MALFTSLLTALGLGTAASASGAAAGAGAAAAAGAGAAGATSIGGLAGAIGTAASVAGTVAGIAGQNKAADAQKKQEQLNEAQMNLESMRQRRNIIRQAQVARATAISNAGAQGALDSSGLAGGQAQISGQTGSNLSGVNAGQQLGAENFAAARQGAAGQQMASFGSGLSSLGGALVKNQDQIGRVGTYLFS